MNHRHGVEKLTSGTLLGDLLGSSDRAARSRSALRSTWVFRIRVSVIAGANAITFGATRTRSERATACGGTGAPGSACRRCLTGSAVATELAVVVARAAAARAQERLGVEPDGLVEAFRVAVLYP